MNKITIQSQQRQAFLQVFGMFSDDGKLTPNSFIALVRSIGVTMATEHLNRMIEAIYDNRPYLTSEEFMKKVYLMNVDFSLLQLNQYFRLLAVENDRFIPLQKIKRMLINQNKTELQIYDITMSLKPFIQAEMFNYSRFLEQFS